MATYTTRDLNRFIKVYPYVRFPQRIVYQYDSIQGVAVEAGKITFTDSDEEIYTFTETYTSIPSAVISTNDAGSGLSNVSITITAISTLSMTVKSSSKFTGQVHVHVAVV